MSEFHAEAPQAIASEGLAQSSYVVPREVFEPATLRTKGVKSTNEPPRPTSQPVTFSYWLSGLLNDHETDHDRKLQG